MALSNLADITRALVALLEWGLRVSGHGSVGGGPRVLALPPDKMSEDGLSVFLYHIQEDPHTKNAHLLPAAPPAAPVQTAPMGLRLYYQVSARFTGGNSDTVDAYQEQLLMSLALRTLHDFPEINDATQLAEPPGPPTNLLEKVGLQNAANRFTISLQPIPYNEGVHFWTAGQSPLRLAAYYEVAVIFLEPNLLPTPVGRVLAYGTYLFTEGAPHITASWSTLTFTIPGEATPRQLVVQPAQVPPGGQLDLQGTGFGGERVELRLFSARWPAGSAVVDAAWHPRLAGDTLLSVEVQPEISFPSAVPARLPLPVLPGVYAAQVRVLRPRPLPTGQTREFSSASNQFPFTVIPRIDSVSLPVAGVVTLTGYLFAHPDLPAEAVEVYVGAHRLARSPSGPPAPGQFSVDGPATLVAAWPAGLAAGQVLPLRVLVAGAEAAPHWLTIS